MRNTKVHTRPVSRKAIVIMPDPPLMLPPWVVDIINWLEGKGKIS